MTDGGVGEVGDNGTIRFWYFGALKCPMAAGHSKTPMPMMTHTSPPLQLPLSVVCRHHHTSLKTKTFSSLAIASFFAASSSSLHLRESNNSDGTPSFQCQTLCRYTEFTRDERGEGYDSHRGGTCGKNDTYEGGVSQTHNLLLPTLSVAPFLRISSPSPLLRCGGAGAVPAAVGSVAVGGWQCPPGSPIPGGEFQRAGSRAAAVDDDDDERLWSGLLTGQATAFVQFAEDR
uniref:Uncharacterized protein n=1 Tax=Oryza barthii TaxID=65489 RepID=A0A0D3F6Y2_9ORYZ